MPFVKVVTSVSLNEEKRAALRDAVWSSITLIPNKTPEVTMVELRDKADLRKGPGEADALFTEVRLFTTPPSAAKKAYAESFFAKAEEITGVKTDKMYLNFIEFNEWGSNGTIHCL